MNAQTVQWIAVGVAAPMLALLLWPRIRQHKSWRAMITPLASIIGSGFLVVGPILAGIAGRWGVEAMAVLCAMAWWFGSAVRFNILHAEPLHEGESHRWLRRLDRLAEAGLALAYFISVAYYLNLLGAFLLKGFGITDPATARWLSSGVIAALGVLGWLRDFRGIERVEIYAVTFKLAVIAGILAALVAVWIPNMHHMHWPQRTSHHTWHNVRVLLGSVILVQGFETSRFLGEHYGTRRRVRSMRWAQALAVVIYISFIALLLPHVPHKHLTGIAKETEIVDILGGIAWLLGPLLVAAGVASQLSAAIADMAGGGGLANGVWSRISPRMAYAGMTVAAIALTWATNIFGIIMLASRAFAVYYFLQCLLAAGLAGRHKPVRCAAYLGGAVVAAAVVALGASAD